MLIISIIISKILLYLEEKMDIIKSPAGQIIKSPSGYTAFLPNPLPPKINWNTQLVNALSRADFLLGKLARSYAVE
jgi:hypothetical protein